MSNARYMTHLIFFLTREISLLTHLISLLTHLKSLLTHLIIHKIKRYMAERAVHDTWMNPHLPPWILIYDISHWQCYPPDQQNGTFRIQRSRGAHSNGKFGFIWNCTEESEFSSMAKIWVGVFLVETVIYERNHTFSTQRKIHDWDVSHISRISRNARESTGPRLEHGWKSRDKIQGCDHPLCCRSLSEKQPLFIGLICGLTCKDKSFYYELTETRLECCLCDHFIQFDFFGASIYVCNFVWKIHLKYIYLVCVLHTSVCIHVDMDICTFIYVFTCILVQTVHIYVFTCAYV